MTSRKNPFYFLLGGLLVALLITPLVTTNFPEVAGWLLTVTLLIATLGLSASKRAYRTAWALIATKIVLDVVGHFHPQLAIHIAEAAVLTAFFVLATVFAFQRVLDGEYVDMNRIAGAISIYMLFGLIWASLYFFLSLMDPQAFSSLLDPSSPDLSSPGWKLMSSAYMDLLYYSYVTLSTLGYGDITPVSRAAQALSYLEAICGVMYVAVLVAALVGSYGNKRVAQA